LYFESYRGNSPFYCVACAVEMGVVEFVPGVTRVAGKELSFSPQRSKTKLVEVPTPAPSDFDLEAGLLYASDRTYKIEETGEVEAIEELILEGLFSAGLSRNKGWDEEDFDQAQIDALRGIEKSCGEFLRGLGKLEEFSARVEDYAQDLTARREEDEEGSFGNLLETFESNLEKDDENDPDFYTDTRFPDE
jgi:hypothetical protein